MIDSRAKVFKVISDERQWGIIHEYIISKFLENRKRGRGPSRDIRRISDI